MRKRKILKAVCLLFAAISAVSFAPPAEAQIDFKLKTNAGSAAVLEQDYYRGAQNDCVRGVLYGCAAPVNSSQVVNWTGEFSGRADVNSTAQALSVSGLMQHSGANKENKYGEATSNYTAQVFADVPPGAGVKIIFRHSVSTTWSIPVNGGYGQAAWSFAPYGGVNYPPVGSGVGVDLAVPSGAPVEVAVSTIETIARWPSPYAGENGGTLVVGASTYYYIGYFDISGYMWMQREIPAGESGSYSSTIDNIEVRHIGKVLKKLPAGDAQTGLVTKPLPKGLNVRVINDDTGIPVANEPVTFTVVAPGHNASLSATPVTDLNGYATAYLTLGTSTGTYTVQATCPGCLPYVNTATFTATAISSFTDVTGVVPDGCTQVAIGERTAQVDPVANSFRVFNVPLVINSPANLLSPEIILTCNNDAECPVANAQRMQTTCAGGIFGAPRVNGGTHDGIDLGLGDGDSILSATQGTVVYIGKFNNDRGPNTSWGTVILIQSTRRVGDEYEVLMYGHLDPKKLYVKSGDPVSIGQEIAAASLGGATGNIRSVLDGKPGPPRVEPRPECLHVHVERRLLAEPLTILGFPIPCAIPSNTLMSRCKGPDMNSNANANAFGEGTPTDPDAAIGCNVYR